jgi:hypothetical protein
MIVICPRCFGICSKEDWHRAIPKERLERGIVNEGLGVSLLQELKNDFGAGKTQAEQLGDVVGAGNTIDMESIDVCSASNPVYLRSATARIGK